MKNDNGLVSWRCEMFGYMYNKYVAELGIKNAVDVRKYTKAVDPEGRKTVAASIAGKRTENFSQLSSNRTTQTEKSEKAGVFQRESEEASVALEGKTNALQARKDSIIGMLRKRLHIPDPTAGALEEQVNEGGRAVDVSDAGYVSAVDENRDLKKGESDLKQERRGLNGEVDAYYEGWKFDTLTPEQKKDLYKTENLKGLTTEEYLELWRRSSPYFVSHATRQGFRDHNAMVYHSGGMLQFADGFTNLLKDDRIIRTPQYLKELKNLDEESIAEYLKSMYLVPTDDPWEGNPLKERNAQEAKERFLKVFNFTLASAPNYPDKTAVHFGAELVLDAWYGAERGNEVFFIFPSDYIASQYPFAFNGREKDFTEPQSESKWNDVFVWTGKEKGISVDAGFVFLPESAKVDPDTGSRYASEIVEIDGEKKRVMVKDENAAAQLKTWLRENSPRLDEYKENIASLRGRRSDGVVEYFYKGVIDDLVPQGWAQAEVIVALNEITSFHHVQKNVEDWDDKKIQDILKESGKLYKKPDVTISSKDYWEKYFADHPDEKPAHIVYYDGNPTVAVSELLKNEGIAKRDKEHDPLLGFPENYVGGYDEMITDPRSSEGYDAIVAKANEIIDEHYGRPESEAA